MRLETIWPAGRRVSFATERYRLRSPLASDGTERVRAWFHQAAFKRSFPGYQRPKTLDDLRKFLTDTPRGKGRTLIVADADGPVGIYWVELAGSSGVFITHHFLGERRAWGKGAVHETRAAVFDVLFQLGGRKLTGMPSANNRAAVQTYRDQGFVEEGRLREHRMLSDGRGPVDVMYFGLLRAEWDYARARQFPEKIRRRLDAAELARAEPAAPARPRPIFETPGAPAAGEGGVPDGPLVIDRLAQVNVANGLVRIAVTTLGADGKPQVSEIAVPARKYNTVVGELQRVHGRMTQQAAAPNADRGRQPAKA